MTDYNFEPDYEQWWNREDLTESDLVWLMLEIDPADAQKSLDLKNKPNLTDEEIRWKNGFSDYRHDLFNGPWIEDSRRELMEKKLWGQGKEDFIAKAYNRSVRFPEPFADFLKSIGARPDHFDYYKNHDFFRDNLKAWNLADIDSEDKAISLLLGINPEHFQRYCLLTEAFMPDDAWNNASPDDRHFFLGFRDFSISEFSLDRMQYGALPGFAKKVKALGLWGGDFSAYAQAVHDGGFVFKSKTYEALEFHGIRPVYTRDGWARSFYRTWIEKGVWRLMDAAFLYIGNDPYRGRSFEGFGETKNKGPGRILQQFGSKDAIFFLVDENGKWVDQPLSRMEEETSPERFVKNHIDAGNLTLTSADDGLKFKPIDIVSFFRKYFPLTYEPQALLIELGLDNDKPDRLQISEFAGGIQWEQNNSDDKTESRPDPLRTGFPGRPSSKHLIEGEFQRRIARDVVCETLAEEARQLRAWLLQTNSDAPLPTVKVIENNIRVGYNHFKAAKQAA